MTLTTAIAAKQATETIPIVIVGVSDPVASSLVGNLARPGGNVTGTASQSYAAVGKEIELIRQLLPNAGRVAALWNPANSIYQQLMLSEALASAARLHMLLRLVEVRTREELDRTFVALGTEPPMRWWSCRTRCSLSTRHAFSNRRSRNTYRCSAVRDP